MNRFTYRELIYVYLYCPPESEVRSGLQSTGLSLAELTLYGPGGSSVVERGVPRAY